MVAIICQRADEDNPSFWGVFWIDATSVETAQKSFLTIARACRLEENIESVKTWLCGKDDWLLIVDNADDPDLRLEQMFPAGNRGAVLVTTRILDFQKYQTAGSCNVEEMTPDDAIALLLKTGAMDTSDDGSTRETAGRVVELLGYLALAIVQAGVVLRQRICSLGEFCEVYTKQKRDLLESGHEQSASNYNHTVYTTWEMSMCRIEKMSDDHAIVATELLRVFSCYHFASIRKDIFERAINNAINYSRRYNDEDDIFNSILVRMMPNDWNGALFGKSVSLLAMFSLVNIKDENISLHPLVHEWVRQRMTIEELRKSQYLAIATLAYSDNDQRSIQDMKHRKSLLPHLDACLSINDNILFQDGPNHSRRLSHATKCAALYMESGRHQKALDLYERLKAGLEKICPANHIVILETSRKVADCLPFLGRHEEAVQSYKTLLEVIQRSIGGNSELAVLTSINLAHCYYSLGEYDQAIALLNQIEPLARVLAGPISPMLASIKTALGFIYRERKMWQLARENMEQAVLNHRKLFGSTHSWTVKSVMSLSDIYHASNMRIKARSILEETLQEMKSFPGDDDDLQQISILRSLAYYRYVKSIGVRTKILREAVAKAKAHLGETHPITLDVMHELVEALVRYGQYARALPIEEIVARETRKTYGQSHWKTLEYAATLLFIRRWLRGRKIVWMWVPNRIFQRFNY